MTVADKRGVSGLTEDHWRRISLGLASYQDVARELGVTRQTVHKAFAARGWTREAWARRQQADDAERQQQANASQQAKTASADVEPDYALMPEGTRAALYRQAGLAVVKAGTLLAAEIVTSVEREKGRMSPTALNSYLRALGKVNDTLIPWLVPPPSEAVDERLPELVVTVMDNDEVAELKSRRTDFGEDEDTRATPVSTAAPVPVATARPSPSTDQSPKPAVLIHDGLPDRSQFGLWLHQLAEKRGRRHLRDIAGALGLTVAAGQDTELIINLILHETGGDPERLRAVAKVVE